MRISRRGIRISVSDIGLLCLLGTTIGLTGPTVAATPVSSTIIATSSLEAARDNKFDSLNPDRANKASEIRVRIFDRTLPKQLQVSNFGSGLSVYVDDDDSPILKVGKGTTLEFSLDGQDVYLRAGDEGIHAGFIRIAAPDGETFTLRTQTGAGRTRQYFGQLEVRVRPDGSGFNMINRVPLESYVAAVVGSEYGLNDLEGSKAMAVAARTYAVHAMQKASNSFHLVDNDRAQVYRGATAATALTREAANATAGEVLTYKGNPIEAVYSSSNGGHSANNESIWAGTPFSYLRGRKDPYDSVSPDDSWRVEIDANNLHAELSRRYGLKVKEVKFGRPGSDGRITSVRLVADHGQDRVISGTQFRSAVASNNGGKSLKSTFFDAKKKGSKYRFDGHGFGHGVGLSQWGAHGMAKDGRKYRDILEFYYPGTRLERRFEGSAVSPGAVALPVVAANPRPSESIASSLGISPTQTSTDVSELSESVSSPAGTPASVAGWSQRKDSDFKARDASVEGSGGSSAPQTKRRLGW